MKKNIIVCTATLVMCLIATLACNRQELEYRLDRTALIPVSIDWTLAQLDPENDPEQDVYSASVWLFPTPQSEYQGAPLEFRFSNPRGGNIEVPIGKYAVLVFNNTLTDFSAAVGFRGTDRYETFEYYSKPQTGKTYHLQPDILAAYHLDTFKVTAEMVTQTRIKSTQATKVADNTLDMTHAINTLVGVKPEQLTRSTFIKVNVEGLNNAAAATGYLRNFPSSVFLATGHTSNNPIDYNFMLNNRQYFPGQVRNGTIEASVTTLGLLPTNSNYTFEVLFRLHADYNGSSTFPTPPDAPFKRDITTEVSNWTSLLHTNIDLGINTPSDPQINLPDITIAGDGGFGVDINDWGDETIIPM